MHPRISLTPAVRYPAVGRCVYCGTPSGPLTKEHVLPFGLNGNLVLPDASCEACAKITSEVERRVLRGFLERGRLALRMASRHKKRERSTTLPASLIQADESIVNKELPIMDSLQVVHLPVLIPPLCLGGRARDGNPEGMEYMGTATLHIGDPAEWLRQQSAVGVRFEAPVDVWAFTRMLGKIAHSYHVAEKGWFPLEESPVLPVVLGKSNRAKEWIGTLGANLLEAPGSQALHLMNIEDLTGPDGSVCSVVRIKLFAPWQGPTYAVATRLQPPSRETL